MVIERNIWKNGRFLLGIVYILSGLTIAIMGFSQLKVLFFEFAPYFPFSVPSDGVERFLNSLPFVFATFVSLVSSVAGCLFGIQWFFTGLTDCTKKFKTVEDPGNLADKDLVISSLLSAREFNSNPLFQPKFSLNNFSLRWFTPATHGVIKFLVRSVFKLLLVIFAIVVIARLFTVAPLLVNRRFGSQFALTVPDLQGLWTIIGVLVAVNFLIIVSFVSTKKRSLDFETRDLLVRGKGTIVFFLAILEELLSLVNSRNLSGNGTSRFEYKVQDDLFAVVDLFESHPKRNFGPANRIVYLLIVSIPLCLIWGFQKLIHFQFPATNVDHYMFFSHYFPAMLVEIISACFLLFMASYFGKLTDNIFQISRFDSYLMVCRCLPANPNEISMDDQIDNLGYQPQDKWCEVHGPENNLLEWMKRPEKLTKFSARIMWTRIATESSFPSGIRKVTSFDQDASLQSFMDEILNVLKSLNFEIEATSETASQLKEQ